MNATLESAAVRQLLPLLEQGRARAAVLQRPILVSLTSPYNGEWPRLAASERAFLWEQPARAFSLFGSGEAAVIDSSGDNRFGHVREGLARLLAEAVISGPAPIALAGFAFDPRQPPEERWQAFSDGHAVLPQLLFSRTVDGSILTLNALINADTDLAEVAAAITAELYSALVCQEEFDRRPRAVDDPNARERWLTNVADLTERIAAGEANKVVLARRLDLQNDGAFDFDAALDRLRVRYPSTTVFAVRKGNHCFLGATPETLVRLEGTTVSADCLAGSYPRGDTPEQDEALGAALLADDKERREHAIVARALCDSLREVCSDLDVPEAPGLKRMANVQHLHTPVLATTDGRRHVLELVERLHPTPATAGLPLQRSLCLIRSHEPFSRGWYAGPIGWLNADGDGEFAVALRSGLLHGTQASLYAGCGIVSGSDPPREYEESVIKLQTMLYALDANMDGAEDA